MKLAVYKGFDSTFLSRLQESPLVDNDIIEKKNVLVFDRKYRKQLNMGLLSLEDDDSVWITYEEFSLIKGRVQDAVKEDGLEVIIYRNNLLPEYYPLEFAIEPALENEIFSVLNGDHAGKTSSDCTAYLSVYNTLVSVDGIHFGSFYNYEYEGSDSIHVEDYYPLNLDIEEASTEYDYKLFINDDIDTFLRDYRRIQKLSPRVIGLSITNGEVSKKIVKSLQAFCKLSGIRLVKYVENIPENRELEEELTRIVKSEIHIHDFKEFRKIKFYKNPDIDKSIIERSQSQIIQEIITQAERSYDDAGGNVFRDIFITAFTGAGKSLMFQVPAVYLAQKYKKLTIIIEPVKALMQDQKQSLNNAGYTRVEAFNSDLITQVEKEAVLERIKNGEVDLLYLSPETLLSYSIETIIGDREIGLIIVDEAHIVTTWGVGFRPDYWYLGSYLNRLRNQIQTSRHQKQKIYRFPICAFTATAINGGIDDSVSDTIISLYMENPIKYIGYARRDDIHFEITHPMKGQRLSMPEYEEAKCNSLDRRINNWMRNREKTIVYFPYASLADSAAKGVKGFAGITTDRKRIGVYTGRNIDETSNEYFNQKKREAFKNFKNGSTTIMYATKAFGMGVDIDDIKNIYHYAVSGNLSDYVQEVGRAARKASITGYAITDFYEKDLRYMRTLFGMSRIRQYQIKKVLEGIYNTYKSKKEARNFLISPESFTYIFNGKNEGQCINQLKICLLMIEKDFYDTYNFKVLISRPQSVFTKAYICIDRDFDGVVRKSEYGKYIRFVAKGTVNEKRRDGVTVSDTGDIYSLDLKGVWENFYPNISFPQFKYWYYNPSSPSKDRIDIMPEIRQYIAPRQKVSIEAKGDLLLSEIREHILEDFEFIADNLYAEYKGKFFGADDFIKLIQDKYGITKARMIANTLFDLIDPQGKCVKRREDKKTGRNVFTLSNGNFKEMMRKKILNSSLVYNLSASQNTGSYSGYITMKSGDNTNIALKLLSIFDYVTYEVVGGEEPEIFIRLNDPNKVKSIVYNNTFYSNKYVTKATQKHDRDVSILRRFFCDLNTDEERWDYIENYFLGYDVLAGNEEAPAHKPVKMSRSVDKDHSYSTNMYHSWEELKTFFDESEHSILDKFADIGAPLPEYLQTAIKRSEEGKDILMSWPSKNTLICIQDTSDRTIEYFGKKGWHAYRLYEIEFENIRKDLE